MPRAKLRPAQEQHPPTSAAPVLAKQAQAARHKQLQRLGVNCHGCWLLGWSHAWGTSAGLQRQQQRAAAAAASARGEGQGEGRWRRPWLQRPAHNAFTWVIHPDVPLQGLGEAREVGRFEGAQPGSCGAVES